MKIKICKSEIEKQMEILDVKSRLGLKTGLLCLMVTGGQET